MEDSVAVEQRRPTSALSETTDVAGPARSHAP